MTSVDPRAWTWHEFASREALATALAKSVASALARALEIEISTHGDSAEVTLAVSGGTTPALFFNKLAKAEIPWRRMIVTLCDERFLPTTSPRSNEALVRRELLKDQAGAARFESLFRDVETVEEAAALANDNAASRFISVAVLGMGLDGHTASLLPDATNIAEALDWDCMDEVIAIRSPSVPEARISLTLQALATAGAIYLHIEGNEKRAAFEQAMRSDPALPVRAVVEAGWTDSGTATQVYWAP